MEQDNQVVTVLISQLVKSGHEQAYEEWVKNIISAARTYPGHLGTNIIRPQPGVRSEYVIILRFDNYENLKTWMTSREREYWLNQVKPLVESEPQIQHLCGIEAWFSLPGQTLKTPPRYKTALLTWAGVYPLISLLNIFLVPLLGSLPKLVISLIVTAIMVSLLTYVIMPRLSVIFRKWLYAK